MNNIYLSKYASAVENALKLKDISDDFVDVDKIKADGYIELPMDDEILKKYNSFRNYMELLYTEKFDGVIAFNSSPTIPSFVAENGPVFVEDNATTTEKYRAYKLALITKVKTSVISDIRINMTDYLKKNLAKRYGKAEENAIINGNGVNEPLGLLNYDLEGIESNAITYDAVIDLFFSLDKDYRDEAVFITSDKTALTLRKLKDEAGNYLWNEATDTILGKKIIISNYMTDEAKPLLFGNFTYLTFLIREKINIKVLKELYMDNNDIGYASKERIDFKLTDLKAVKVLTISSNESN